ncbi:RNA methyltransferase [bacterium]|nr:RNA methyltransferase [bacterium]
MSSHKTDRPMRSIKWYASLRKAKTRKSEGMFIIRDFRAVEQIVQNTPESIDEILYTDILPAWAAVFPARQVDTAQMKIISAAITPQGMAAVVKLPEDLYSNTLPTQPAQFILALDDVQDPGNTGTLIRTAAAFNFDGVLLNQGCADPFGPKVVQATAGALGSLWLRKTDRFIDIILELKDKGKTIIIADTHGTADPSILKQSSNVILCLGNEAAGPSEELRKLTDYSINIPMNTTKIESLNVAVSGGILMAQMFRE